MSSSFVRRGLVTAAVVGAIGLWWLRFNRAPTVQFDNLRYIQQLTSAVSSRDEDWLNKVEVAIGQRRASSQMSDAEFGHFQEIITIARSGSWEEADKECFQFAEAQLNRQRSAPASEIHNH
jgi:hypothetical protein